jgi:hypothetical protein
MLARRHEEGETTRRTIAVAVLAFAAVGRAETMASISSPATSPDGT